MDLVKFVEDSLRLKYTSNSIWFYYLLNGYPIVNQLLNYLIISQMISSTPLYLQISNGLVVKALDSQSRGPVLKTTGLLQGQLSLSSFRVR